jgi:hypothetical protein
MKRLITSKRELRRARTNQCQEEKAKTITPP